MNTKEWTQIRHNAQLDVGLLHAFYVQHSYPRHSHDYYVICLIEHGRQSFTHKGTKHITPPGGVILINPGAAHTGEAADEHGFEMRSLYPTTAHMEMVVFELTGRQQGYPFFKDVRIDDQETAQSILHLHKVIAHEESVLEYEAHFLWTLARLVRRYTEKSFTDKQPGKEKKAVEQARHYIEEYFAKGISLDELAQHVALSPYYFLRVFRAEVGMPPYTYLESVRIRHAQRLIESGLPLAQVAVEVGFSSQSHLTRCFKKIIGVTPGQYAQQTKA